MSTSRGRQTNGTGEGWGRCQLPALSPTVGILCLGVLAGETRWVKAPPPGGAVLGRTTQCLLPGECSPPSPLSLSLFTKAALSSPKSREAVPRTRGR